MNLEINRKVTICATFTAEQWQLYSSMDGVDSVADGLNNALNLLVNRGFDRKTVENSMHKEMQAVRHFGAIDSEPMWFLQDVLDEIFTKSEGI